MTAHLIAAPPTPTRAQGAWLSLSAAFTDQTAELTGREDLTVTCTPGAGQGAPGCFIPALARIELDGTHLGQRPATCDPRRPSDRERYPALWGVFLHEAAHAHHSTWRTPGRASAAHVDAAMNLEESRIEAVHLRRRPADRRWLRASARQLILADYTTTGPLQVPMTAWDAARAAALLMARVSAGVLDDDETAALVTTVTDILGPSRLSALAALWHIAHTTPDNAATTMLELGKRWCTILDINPTAPAPKVEGDAESSRPSPLSAAITSTLDAVTTSDTPPPSPELTSRDRQRQADTAARERAAHAAHEVFKNTHDNDGPTEITGTRAPHPDEQTAARRLGRALRSAAHRERATTTTTSATPPGRLRMRGALAADAQRAAGAMPTAEPFTRTQQRRVPTPPLRVGIACDVSGSMSAFTDPVASAAWILARAAAHIPDARSATVIFGAHVRPVTYPGQTPTRVPQFTALGNQEDFCKAVDALDAALDLSQPNAARLLVIVSDGHFWPEQRTGGQQRITRLTGNGCAVLWLAPHRRAIPMTGTHPVILSDPAQTAATIGAAATRALRTT